ncbi:MAG TPA: hypothetical protein VIK04_11225, partial [Solirubrobacteraceae bacterium]
MCFDVSTDAACSGQPFDLGIGTGNDADSNYPPPDAVALGSQMIVPVALTPSGDPTVDELACFDDATQSACSGTWPSPLSFSYNSSAGAAFPLLSATGALQGLCLPTGTDQCFGLDGSSVATPAGMTGVIPATSGWNGPAFVLGPRVYVPDGNTEQVECFDYSTGASCANFPKTLSGLELMYTVNPDPQRPTCIWVNADGGQQQIQSFDAYSGRDPDARIAVRRAQAGLHAGVVHLVADHLAGAGLIHERHRRLPGCRRGRHRRSTRADARQHRHGQPHRPEPQRPARAPPVPAQSERGAG